MIQKLTHTTIYVLDQERAKAFYTEKLGFEVLQDQTMGTFRWLTVAPKGQSEWKSF
jgi:catechol 2,3-dioxygenase-like lactoylglutathione lyase family enzyme